MDASTSPFMGFLGWLLRASGQATLLIGLILVVQLALRERLSARWRYGLWLLLLVRLAMPWAPPSRLSVFNAVPSRWGEQSISGAPVRTVPAGPSRLEPSVSTNESVGIAKSLEPAAPVGAFAPVLEQDSNASSRGFLSSLPVTLPLVWLMGALVLGGYALLQSHRLSARVGRQRPMTEPDVLNLLEDCKAHMGVNTYLSLVQTDRVKSPSLLGFIRPRLLLPEGLTGILSPEELRFVFLHELAHLKRHDVLVNWLMTLLQVLHWFNPLVWYAFYRMRAERELACDALALRYTRPEESRQYGQTLIRLLEDFSRPRRLAGMAGILENPSQLKRRMIMIARFKPSSYQGTILAVALLIVLGGVGLTDARPASDWMSPDVTAPAGGRSSVELAIANEDLVVSLYPEGDLYTAGISIHNAGTRTTPSFKVHFYRGDPERGGELIHGSVHGAGPIEPGGVWNEGSMPFALEKGENLIVVLIDPDNEVIETDETNNKASVVVHREKQPSQLSRRGRRRAEARTAETGLPDPAISDEDFRIRPYPEGGLYTAGISIHNQGAKTAPSFKVHFYRGDPDQGGTLICKAFNQSAGPIEPGGVWNEGSMPFSLEEGENLIVVLIDPDNEVIEADETNNRVSKLFTIGLTAEEKDRVKKMTIYPGKGTDLIGMADTKDKVLEVLGEPPQVRDFGRNSMLNYRDTLALDFLVRSDSGDILEIRFNRGYEGSLENGVRIGSSLDEVLEKSGGVLKTVEGTPDQTHGVRLGTDRVLYRQMRDGEVSAHKFMDGQRGILYWFDRDKKVTQIVVFRPHGAE